MTQPDTALKRTPLHAAHVRLGARMIPFGGWDMPVQYSGIVEEHRAVRSAVGCFDVSHMGEFEFRGPDAPPGAPAAHHQRCRDARGRPGPVLAALLRERRHRGRPHAVPAHRRSLHDDGQRVQHRQGLGVGQPPSRGPGRRAERERGDGADRRPGTPRRATGGAPLRRRRLGDRLLPLPSGPGGGRSGDHLPHGLHGGGRVRALPARQPAPSRCGSGSWPAARRTAWRPSAWAPGTRSGSR